MSFKFRFQKVLDFKIGEEEKAQKELAEWVKRYNDCLSQLSKIDESQKSLQKEVLSGTTGSSIGQVFQEFSSLIIALKQELVAITGPLNEKREQYLQAKRDKETFEILKQKEYKKFLYQQKKREQAILDEYGRNMFIIEKQQKED